MGSSQTVGFQLCFWASLKQWTALYIGGRKTHWMDPFSDPVKFFFLCSASLGGMLENVGIS